MICSGIHCYGWFTTMILELLVESQSMNVFRTKPPNTLLDTEGSIWQKGISLRILWFNEVLSFA